MLDTAALIECPFAFRVCSGNPIPDDTPGSIAELVREQKIEFDTEPNAVVLSSIVAQELNHIKDTRDDWASRCARAALADINSIARFGAKSGQLSREGIVLPNGAIFFEVNYRDSMLTPHVNDAKDPYEVNNDTKIVATLRKVHERIGEEHEGVCKVILVTDDHDQQRKARGWRLHVENFRYGAVRRPVKELYTGWIEHTVPENLYHAFRSSKQLTLAQAGINPDDVHPNQVVYLMAEDKGGQLGLVSGKKQTIRRAKYIRAQGEKSRNGNTPIKLSIRDTHEFTRDQKALMELLRDPNIGLVSAVGTMGTGKTLCSILAGIQQVNEGTYQRVLYIRPIQTMGNDIGYLPGDMGDKMEHWGRPARDNMRYIFGYNEADSESRQRIDDEIERIIKKGIVSIEPQSYMPGQSITNSYIVVDEAHNLSRGEIKMIIGRCGTESKVVVVGDPDQVLNGKGTYVTKQRNGLVSVCDAFPGDTFYGHMTLTSVKRGRVANMARKL